MENSRKINIEITGIPVVQNEDCKQIVYKLVKVMNVEEEYLNNIDVAHRLLSVSEEKIPAIIKTIISIKDQISKIKPLKMLVIRSQL